jgi:transcriptional regulator with XRE-family HTH domain
LAEVATAVDLDPAQVEAYEKGNEAIPFLQLEKLGEQLNVPIDYFLDDGRGPLQRHEARQQQLRRFEELPADVQAFVLKPTNISYLQTAMRLSEMDAEQLRSIATALLEITY